MSIYYYDDELEDEFNYCTQRQSYLSNWKVIHLETNAVIRRIDTPRDSTSQYLDGHNPFSWSTETDVDNQFIEPGKPFTAVVWDDDKLRLFSE